MGIDPKALMAAKDAYAKWALNERIPYGKDLNLDEGFPIAITAYEAAESRNIDGLIAELEKFRVICSQEQPFSPIKEAEYIVNGCINIIRQYFQGADNAK